MLGKGGFAQVYEVTSKTDRGHYALKIVNLPKMYSNDINIFLKLIINPLFTKTISPGNPANKGFFVRYEGCVSWTNQHLIHILFVIMDVGLTLFHLMMNCAREYLGRTLREGN